MCSRLWLVQILEAAVNWQLLGVDCGAAEPDGTVVAPADWSAKGTGLAGSAMGLAEADAPSPLHRPGSQCLMHARNPTRYKALPRVLGLFGPWSRLQSSTACEKRRACGASLPTASRTV